MAYAKKTAVAALVAGGIASGGYVGHTYIDQDGGGVVSSYVASYDRLQREHVNVIIRGVCASGLGYDNVCLLPSAQLGLHPGYNPILSGLFGYTLNPYATKLMWDHYPADVRAVVSKHMNFRKGTGVARDGLRWYPAVTYISAEEFPEHLCPETT